MVVYTRGLDKLSPLVYTSNRREVDTIDTTTLDTEELQQQYRLNYWTLNEYQIVGYGDSVEATLLANEQALIVQQLGYTPEA